MARNPAAQTAFGPMVQAAIEQYEPPQRRLVTRKGTECQMGGLLPGFPGSPAGECSKE